MACYTWCWNGLLLDIMLVQQMKKLLAQWSCWVHPGGLMSETIHDHRQFVCVSLILRICCPLRVLRLSDFLYWCLSQQPADATWLSVIVGNVRFVGGLTPTGWRWPPHWWLKIVVWGSASTPPTPIQQDQHNVQVRSHHSLLITCAASASVCGRDCIQLLRFFCD